MENLYDKRIKARRLSKWLKPLGIFLGIVLYFWVANLLVLVICQYAEYGLSTRNTRRIYGFLGKVKEQPFIVYKAYWIWLKHFFSAAHLSFAAFIPWLSPLVFFYFVISNYIKSKNPFSPQSKKYNHWANGEEVRQMPIAGGSFLALGSFDGRRLRLDKASSVLVWGASAQGKTSTVAIPSILESNTAAIVALDHEGSLADYTSGHRSGLGQIFYFDWSRTDNPSSGTYGPRWNPLSNKDMPDKNDKREAYLKKLAQHLLPFYGESSRQQQSITVIEVLLNFFVAKFEQACANDYLLTQLINNQSFTADESNILLSYYAAMDCPYIAAAVQNVQQQNITEDNYLPIGSWNGISASWQGKELCLAMITDSIMQQYLSLKEQSVSDIWYHICTEYKKEAILFGYGANIVALFDNILHQKPKIRDILFSDLAELSEIFQTQSIRERTATSDFSLKQIRGRKDEASGEWRPNTIYLCAKDSQSSFMSRLLLDMLMEQNLEKSKYAAKIPLFILIDDLEQMPQFHTLEKSLQQASNTNTGFMLLTNSLKNLNEIYGKNGVENIIKSTPYKLVFAPNNIELSKQFRELAVYGAKSPLPRHNTRTPLPQQKFNDAYYYRRIADELLNLKENKGINRGTHVLLAAGYYNLPIKADVKTFEVDARFSILAGKPPHYSLDESIINKRNHQDMEVPSAEEALNPEPPLYNTEEPSGSTFSAETPSPSPTDEWWMDDKAFELSEPQMQNPFEDK